MNCFFDFNVGFCFYDVLEVIFVEFVDIFVF